MTDRELLEAAAKAAGITLRWIQGPNDDECIHPIRRRDDGMCEVDWNPLTDDGDALRLAAKLKLHILHNDPHEDVLWVSAVLNKTMFHAAEEFLNEEDRAQAPRRAIVRAAAKIGEAAKENK